MLGRQPGGPPPVPVRLQKERQFSDTSSPRFVVPQKPQETSSPRQEGLGYSSSRSNNNNNNNNNNNQVYERPTRQEQPGQQVVNHHHSSYGTQQQQRYTGYYNNNNNVVPLVHDPRVEQDMDRKFAFMERRMLELEQERKRYQLHMDQKFNELKQMQSQGKSAIDANLERENKYLKQKLHELGKHVGSLEELIVSRTNRFESLQQKTKQFEEVTGSSLPQIRQDIADLKQVFFAQQERSKEEVSSKAITSELNRLDSVFNTVDGQLKRMAQDFGGSLDNLNHRNSMYAQKVEGLLSRESQFREEQNEQVHALTAKLESMQAQLGHVVASLQEDKLQGTESDDAKYRMIDETRDALVRLEQKISDKLATFMDDVTMRIDLDREGYNEQRGIERAEISTQVKHVMDILDSDRRNYDMRIAKLQEQFVQKGGVDDMRIAEFRNELEARLDNLARDLQREETSRIDAVRRIHEDVIDHIDAQGGAGKGNNQEASDEVSHKLIDLEEVVRAEVRSRMRHEAKAREHVENTAKTLQLSMNQDRDKVNQLQRFVEKNLSDLRKNLETSVMDAMEKLESKLIEEAQDRRVSQADMQEQINSCDAKIAKRAAMHQIDMSRIESTLLELRGLTDQQFLDVQTLVENLRSEVHENRQYDLSRLEKMIKDVQSDVYGHSAEERKAIDFVIEQLRNSMMENQNQTNAYIASEAVRLQNGIDNVKLSLEMLESNRASESCIEGILSEIEKKEGEEAKEQKQMEIHQHLKDMVTNSMHKVEQSIGNYEQQLQSALQECQSKVEAAQTHATETSAMFDQLKQETKANAELLKESYQQELDARIKEVRETLLEQEKNKMDQMEVQLSMQGAIISVLENADKDHREHVQAEMKSQQESMLKALEQLQTELATEQKHSKQVETRLNEILQSMQEEKQQKEEEWEQSVAEAQSFLLEDDSLLMDTNPTSNSTQELQTMVSPVSNMSDLPQVDIDHVALSKEMKEDEV